MEKSKNLLISICGPTASGKTDLSVQLAKHFGTEIISNDSRQFYQEMRIGTARPSADELRGVPHHFLGDRSIHSPLSIGSFHQEATQVLEGIFEINPIVIMVGGSMMYEKALAEGLDDLPPADSDFVMELTKEIETHGLEPLQDRLKKLDPEYYATADLKNPRRLIRALDIIQQTGKTYSELRKAATPHQNFRLRRIFIDLPREKLYHRINTRVDRMITDGLEEEAKNLSQYRHLTALQTVGYKEFFDFFEDKINRDQAIDAIKQNTRRFAKRQLTWYRKMDFDHHLSPGLTHSELLSLSKSLIL